MKIIRMVSRRDGDHVRYINRTGSPTANQRKATQFHAEQAVLVRNALEEAHPGFTFTIQDAAPLAAAREAQS